MRREPNPRDRLVLRGWRTVLVGGLLLACQVRSADGQVGTNDVSRMGSAHHSSSGEFQSESATAREIILPKITSASTTRPNPTAGAATGTPVPPVLPGTPARLQLARRGTVDRGSTRDAVVGQMDVMRVATSLGIVLVLFVGFVWLLRRLHRHPRHDEPQLFQVLGEFPLIRNQRAHVVKFANRILVLADSGRGLQRLTEITDPAELKQIETMCATPGLGTFNRDREISQKLRDAVAREQVSFTSTQNFA